MKLAYITRGNSNPQGKPRVYFTGHPDDMALLNSIASDILELQNCVVFYDEAPWEQGDLSDFLRQLEGMQLFVIPVTARFLNQPNRALSAEIPFARDHDIPILPLMQEPGLEKRFNEVCGKLQYLGRDGVSDDAKATAGNVLSYQEKLAKFLSSILVGDDLAREIRKAFDARIFLSYRKVDREYAQKLMRQIHSCEFCRDFAIWYDEYLVPGKNFREAIREALTQSHLFALAVTENLLENDNFVLTDEYPMALKRGKPIFPALVCPTNQSELQAKYPRLPACVDAGDPASFRAALLAAVRDLDVKKHDRSPEHDFLIGLAYLNGIDVEVDRRRAVELITGAAQAGLPAAISKLVEMYRSGNGVERNYQTAVYWQEQLVVLAERWFDLTHDEQDALTLMVELMVLAECCDDLWDKAAAQRACIRAKEIGDAMAAETESPKIQDMLASVCEALGGIYHLERKFADARLCYRQALELNRKQWDRSPTRKVALRVSSNYEQLGGLCYAEGDLEQAEAYYGQSLGLAQMLHEENGGVSERIKLSHSHEAMGRVLRAQGKLEPAKAHFQEALSINRQLHQELKNLYTLQAVANDYNYLGNISMSQGNLQGALDYFSEFVQISRRCYEELGDAQAKRDLAVGLGKMGNVFLRAGQPADAEPYYLENVQLARQLVEENGTVESRRLLGVGLEHLGRVAYEQGHTEQAKGFYRQGIQVSEPLCRELGTPETKRNLSILYERLGTIAQGEHDLEEAKRCHMACLQLRQQMLAQANSPDARKAVLYSSHTLGALLDQMGEVDEARVCYWNVVALQAGFYRDYPNPQTAQYLMEACSRLINLYRSRNLLAGAVACNLDCLDMYQTLYEQTAQPDIRRGLLLCCIDHGTLHARMDHLAEARQYFQYAVTLARKAAEEEQSEESYDYLALACTRLGGVSGASGRELFLEAYHIWDQLSKIAPDNSTYAEGKALALQMLRRYGEG